MATVDMLEVEAVRARADIEDLRWGLGETDRILRGLAVQSATTQANLDRYAAESRAQAATTQANLDRYAAESRAEAAELRRTVAETSANLDKLERTVAETSANLDKLERTVAETSANLDKLERTVAETSATVAETSANLDKLERTVAETSATVAKTSANLDKLERTVAETSRQMGRIHNSIGEIVEIVIIPGLKNKMNTFGYNFEMSLPRKKFPGSHGETLTEVDLLLVGSKAVMAVEVKRNLTTDDVYGHLERILLMREHAVVTKVAGKALYAAVAGIDISDHARRLAEENGMYIVAVDADTKQMQIVKPEAPTVW